jgi:signal peptidase I
MSGSANLQSVVGGRLWVGLQTKMSSTPPTPPIKTVNVRKAPIANHTQIEIRLSGSALSELMQEVLIRGASLRFQAKGHSMSPFIRDKDIITISQIRKEAIRPGNVVAVVNPVNNTLIVHRVIDRTENGILLKGDNLNTPDGVFTRDTIIGVVTNVERNGKRVRLTSIPVQELIALASRSGLLNSFILPFLRKVKNVGKNWCK